MAIEPRQIAGMVEESMGAGGQVMPEEDSLAIELDDSQDVLPEGIELADEGFRESSLNRFASQSKTIEAFKILKENGIKRTAYNIIGLPNQNEESILKTIEFNKELDPDNITVAFYSTYYGTKSQIACKDAVIFDDYEFDVDSALRSKTKDSDLLPINKLKFYKENFVRLVRNEI